MEQDERKTYYVMEVANEDAVADPNEFSAKNLNSAKRTAVRTYKAFRSTVMFMNTRLDEKGYVDKKGALFRGKDGKWVQWPTNK